MKRGATRDYTGGQKNNWRRWGWNRLLGRLDGREKAQPILYLAGPQDRDRGVAISKGVPPTNLIAIDRASRNVNRVRHSGGVAVCADVVDVLNAWPFDRPVAAVVLDFCAGLDPELVISLTNALYRKPFATAWAWLNLQRGRDPSWNPYRQEIVRIFKNSTPHRGRQFAFAQTIVTMNNALSEWGHERYSAITVQEWCDRWSHCHCPLFHSYKSLGDRGSALVFDTVIYSPHPQSANAYDDGAHFDFCEWERQVERMPRGGRIRQTRRLVSAALAVRTMRADR